MQIANNTTIIWETRMICASVAWGLMYRLYTSYVRREDTAISSADVADVTAKNYVNNWIRQCGRIITI